MIDGHAHLNEIPDADGAVLRAKAAGIQAVIAVGMDVRSNLATLEIARRHPGVVYPAVGIHPWSIDSGRIEEEIAFVRENLPSCIALGEVGLDYGAKVKKKIQWSVFERLLALAAQMKKPAIIHSRYSYERTFAMAREAAVERAVFHWYSGPVEILKKILDAGYSVSATPALATSPQHRAAMELAPLDRILVETDAPVEYGGKASEPADLGLTIRELAGIKRKSTEEVAQVTEQNTRSLYAIL
jgi:TatD DNase family protein